MHGNTNPGATRPAAARPYYEAHDKAHDDLLRCHDCNRLVVYAAVMANKGTTPCCATRRMREVRALSIWEWIKIRLGVIDFAYRKEFLAEFARGR